MGFHNKLTDGIGLTIEVQTHETYQTTLSKPLKPVLFCDAKGNITHRWKIYLAVIYN